MQGYHWEKIIAEEHEIAGLLSSRGTAEEAERDEEQSAGLSSIVDWLGARLTGDDPPEELPKIGDPGDIESYQQLVQDAVGKAMADGTMSPDEKSLVLSIRTHYRTYESALKETLSDGKITREEYSLLKTVASMISNNVLDHALMDGTLTEEEKSILETVKASLETATVE